MGRETPADIVFRRAGPEYRAAPPVYRAHPPTKNSILIRNLTGSAVDVWSPQGVLVGTPRRLKSAEEYDFPINPDILPGSYVYTAYVVDANQFVEGNSPPEIIIDK